MTPIDNICDQYIIARSQRKKERDDGLGDEGTQGYADTGCYRCDGYDTGCQIYSSRLPTSRGAELLRRIR